MRVVRPKPHQIKQYLVSFLRILVKNKYGVGTESLGSVDPVKEKNHLPSNSRTGYAESGEVSLRSAKHLEGMIDLCWNREVRGNVHISYALSNFKFRLNFSRTYLHGTLSPGLYPRSSKVRAYVS